MQSSGDTDCHLSCFRMWVGVVFNMHSSGDTVAFFVLECELACFLLKSLSVIHTLVLLF